MHSYKKTSLNKLIEHYDVILFDAYGVLVTKNDYLPGAPELITKLNNSHKDYYILTNSSIASTEELALEYRKKSLQIPKERIFTSGSLIKRWLQENFSTQPRCLSFGINSFINLVKTSGAQTITIDDIIKNPQQQIDALILGMPKEDNFVAQIGILISYLFKQHDNKNKIHYLLPNPDVIYPKESSCDFGLAPGSAATLIEKAFSIRYPNYPIEFEYLGKPSNKLFAKVKKLHPDKKIIMIGDQIATDIKGAHNAGIDSALITTGVSSETELKYSDIKPQFILEHL
jgi:HAD superfamily hydrolase (TIGR01450 family)